MSEFTIICDDCGDRVDEDNPVCSCGKELEGLDELVLFSHLRFMSGWRQGYITALLCFCVSLIVATQVADVPVVEMFFTYLVVYISVAIWHGLNNGVDTEDESD